MRPAAELDLPVVLDRDAATPLHVQLAAALRSMALSGVLPAGGRLPATRLLAARLGVARSTVLAAYEQLDGEGYLHSRHGSGTYLTAHLHPVAARQHRVAVPDRCDDSADPPGVVDLRPGRPRTDRLADPAWTRAWRAAAATAPAAEAPRLGLAALRREISAHLAVARGLVADPEQVLITAGARDGLALLALALDAAGRRVAVEDPGYPATRRVLTRLGADLVAVAVDHDGLVVDALPRGARVPRLLVVTPSHQYPLGGRLPVDRRLALLDWASRHDVVLAEDDYDSEFRFDVAPLPALAALDTTGRVAHLATFSKVLTPWLRAGYLVAPPWLLPALAEVRHDLATPVSGIDQQALATYLATGALRRHIARSRRDYAHARAHLARRLAPHTPRIRLRGTNAGLHAVLELPPDTDIHNLLEHCRDRGVLLTTLADYDMTPRQHPHPTVILGYGDATLAQLDQAIDALLTGLEDHHGAVTHASTHRRGVAPAPRRTRPAVNGTFTASDAVKVPFTGL